MPLFLLTTRRRLTEPLLSSSKRGYPAGDAACGRRSTATAGTAAVVVRQEGEKAHQVEITRRTPTSLPSSSRVVEKTRRELLKVDHGNVGTGTGQERRD